MNESILLELKVVVERVVRPLRTTLARKRRMREELLAHLTAIYEEEAGRLGEGEAALARAKKRFGDPAALREEFQRGIPLWERTYFWMEKLRREPGESVPHLFGKHLLMACVCCGAALLLLLVLSLGGGRVGEYQVWFAVRLILAMAVLTLGYSFTSVLLGDGLTRALYRADAQRSRRKAVLWVLWMMLLFPVLAYLTYVVALGDLVPDRFPLTLACLSGLAPSLLLALMAPSEAEGVRHEQEWAALEIAES